MKVRQISYIPFSGKCVGLLRIGDSSLTKFCIKVQKPTDLLACRWATRSSSAANMKTILRYSSAQRVAEKSFEHKRLLDKFWVLKIMCSFPSWFALDISLVTLTINSVTILSKYCVSIHYCIATGNLLLLPVGKSGLSSSNLVQIFLQHAGCWCYFSLHRTNIRSNYELHLHVWIKETFESHSTPSS